MAEQTNQGSAFADEQELPSPEVQAARDRMPPRLDALFADALARIRHRKDGTERPLPLPWASVAALYGGGFWPGLHVLVAGTGAGKSTLALQAALHAAQDGFPVAYVGLELDQLQVALRVVGERARVPWSKAYTGNVSDSDVEKLEQTMQAMAGESLPFYPEFGPTNGWAVSRLAQLVADLRTVHPESNGQPALVVVDFLQLVADETDGKPRDLRERVGAVAYAAREAARVHNACILLVSSAARDKYATLAGAIGDAGIGYVNGRNGEQIATIARPDTLVGLGKESGEIEYAADSVSVAVRLPDPLPDGRRGVVLAVPKLRTGPPAWAPLIFTGTTFVEPSDVERKTVRDVLADQKKEAQTQQRTDTQRSNRRGGVR